MDCMDTVTAEKQEVRAEEDLFEAYIRFEKAYMRFEGTLRTASPAAIRIVLEELREGAFRDAKKPELTKKTFSIPTSFKIRKKRKRKKVRKISIS